MLSQQATHQGANAKAGKKGTIEVAHPFPFFTLRGKISDISLGNGHNHTTGNTLQEANQGQASNIIDPYIAERSYGESEKTDTQNWLPTFTVGKPADKKHSYSSGDRETGKDYTYPDTGSTHILGIKRQKRRYYTNTQHGGESRQG
jgi:hypothetical protein